MRLSVLVLTYRRLPELLACLDSLGSDGAQGRCEVLVGLNDDPAGNAAVARVLSERHPWARPLSLPRLPRGEARNRLAAEASGDALWFLDDDAYVPPGFLGRAAAAFRERPGAAAIGGPNVGPPGAAAFPRAVDFLLRSPLGAGPMRVRHLRRGPAGPAPGWTFTLSNLGVRREVFRRGLRFPARSASAEETLFLHELERAGLVAVHDPALFAWHRRRAGLSAFLRQTWSCGVGRAQITRAAPASLLPATLAPLALAAASAALGWAGAAAGLALPALYAAACAAEGVRMAVQERDPAALLLPALLPLAHAAYAGGLLAGLLAAPASDAAVEPRLSWDARPADS